MAKSQRELTADLRRISKELDGIRVARKKGRPATGLLHEYRIHFYVDRDLFDLIAIAGKPSRSAWIRQACENQIKRDKRRGGH